MSYTYIYNYIHAYTYYMVSESDCAARGSYIDADMFIYVHINAYTCIYGVYVHIFLYKRIMLKYTSIYEHISA